MQLRILILIALLGLSCQRFQKNFETVAMRCGLSPNTIDHSRKPLQLVLESGLSPTATVLANIQARFIDAENNQENLAISPRGCVFVPTKAGLVQAFASDPGLHASVQNPDADTIVLKKKMNFDLDLLCPKEGLYSRGELPSPLRINAQGSLESVDLVLTARDESRHLETILLSKPYGITGLASDANVLSSDMPEGVYQLKLAYKTSMDQWDRPFQSPLPPGDCQLIIQKQPPVVQGLSYARTTGGRPVTLKKGERLGWYADSPIHYELRFCREKIAADEDQLVPAALECEAQDHCRDEKNFELIEQKRADSNGLFQYFIYAEDRAGNRSPTHCERIAVSGSAPHLGVSWKNPAWNIPLSVMEDAALDIEAQAAVSHPELLDSSLLERLECKVDFRMSRQTIIPGDDVLCTAGSCKGQNLGDYRPCDEHIRFSLSRFWKNQKAQRLEMRLHVRASDAAGQIEESSRSLWIYPERFEPQLMADPEEGVDAIYEANDQVIFMRQGSLLMQWNEETQTWQKSELPAPAETTHLRTVQSKDGAIYAVWKSPDKIEAAVWKEKNWTILPTHARLDSCFFNMQAHPRTGFWCQNFDDAVLWQNERWQDAGLPKGCRITAPMVLSQDNSTFIACADKRLMKRASEGNWESLPAPPHNTTSISLDTKGRPWIQTHRMENAPTRDSIFYLEGQDWQLVEARPLVSDPRRYSVLFGSSDGTLHYDDSVWDETTKSWQRPAAHEAAFPDTRTFPQIDIRGQKILWTDFGFALPTHQGFRFFPLAGFGITIDDSSLPLFDSKGRFWFLSELMVGGPRKLYRIDPTPWHTYAEEAGLKLGQQFSQVSHIWLNQNRLPEFFFSHGGVMRATTGAWMNPIREITPHGQVFASIYVDGHARYYGDSYRRLYAFAPDGTAELLREFPDIVETSAYPDAQGRLWVHQVKSRDVWILDGKNLIPAPLPESYKITTNISWFMLPDRILVVNGYDIYRWNEANQSWDISNQVKEGLPYNPRVMLQAGPEHLVIQMSAASSLRLFDKKVNKVSTLARPPVDPASGIFTMTEQGLFFLARDKGLYWLKDGIWQALITTESLQKRLNPQRSIHFQGMVVDPYQRIWIHGAPYQVLRFDLKTLSRY